MEPSLLAAPLRPDRPTQSQWRILNRAVVALAAVALLLPVAVNLLIDPYGVFGVRLFDDGPLLNERVVKYRHLSAQPQPVDLILTGSSVMGVVRPELVAPGRASFNLSFFSATPVHIQKVLQALEDIDRLPPVIIIGIDPFMLASPNLSSPQMRLPIEASDGDQVDFLREFLFAGSIGASANKVFDHFSGAPGVLFDRASGTYRLAMYDRAIDRDHAAYLRQRFSGRPLPAALPDLSPGVFELGFLVAWLRDRPRVRTLWVLQPVHRSIRQALDESAVAYRPRVLEILGPDVVDLTDLPMTSDDRLWYEAKHFRPEAVPAIVQPIVSALSPSSSRVATVQ